MNSDQLIKYTTSKIAAMGKWHIAKEKLGKP